MVKHMGREFASRLAQHEVPVRRDEVETQLVGGLLATFWTERMTISVEKFSETIRSLGVEPSEHALLEALGISSETVHKGSLRIVYNVNPRDGMRPIIHLRWRAMSFDVPEVYLRELAAATEATVNA